MNNQGNIVDLSYIQGMAGGSMDLVKEMIVIFIGQIPDFLDEMKSCFHKKDWYNLGLIAHKAKSSVAVMGMEGLATDLKDLEILTKEGKEIEEYERLIESFENQTKKAIQELNEILKSE